MKVTVVILHYRNVENTLECIESVKSGKTENYQLKIILVDNNPNIADAKLSKISEIIYIKNNQNLGFSGGMNVGIKKALEISSDYVLVLNNDTILDANCISNMVKTNGEIIAPKIYFAKGHEFHKKRYKKSDLGKIIWYAGGKIDWNNVLGTHIGVDEIDHGQYSVQHETDLATGACMMVSVDVFKKIGLFNEKYFLYLEDLDFCVRAKKSGVKVLFEPSAIIWHKNAESAGGSGSDLQDYFISRNRLIFAFKYAKLRTKLAVLKQAILQSNQKIKRQALIDFLIGNFNQGSYKI